VEEAVPRFKWIEWNLDKTAGHRLSFEEVEYGFENGVGLHQEREDGSFETIGVTPSGRTIFIVWRYDEEIDAVEDDGRSEVVFVITAF
jgi:hypothetical protein